MVEFDRAAFIGKFQEEANEYLQRLNESVIALETTPEDAALIDQMLRDAHTLKGSSRMVGLMDVSDISHRLEDLMVSIRDGEVQYTPEMSDLFFEALDVIVFLSENAGKDVETDIDLEDLSARLSQLAESGELGATPDAEEPTQEKAPKRKSPKEKTASAKASKKATKKATKKAAGEPTVANEPADEADPLGESDAEMQDARPEDALKPKIQPTIRVRTSQVDALLNLISEVVISRIKTDGRTSDLRTLHDKANDAWQEWTRLRGMLDALGLDEDGREDVVESVGHLDATMLGLRRELIDFVKGYTEDASRASTVVSDLQSEGMRLRMLPVSTVFNGFPRAVRDLAREFDKEVELTLEGESTELDKKVLEEINDPLVHIMRNAVDHGIEAPDVREEAGKPRKGHIRLAARQEGDNIVIEIEDDGAGIDPDAVRAAAVRKGYISEAEAAALSDREATFLIFEQGFSTSAIITEISGRGVGMDVVRQFIVDKLRGSLNVSTRLREGTTFQLTIPLTLAIIRALVLQVGTQVFAIPTSSIEETIRIDASDVVKVEGREVIRRQRRNIPLVRLGDVIGIDHASDPGSKVPLVVVGFSGHRLGFIADAFLGEQQIVIKSLGSHLRKVENVAGVTVLGAGQVVPILSIPDLMGNARHIAGIRTRAATRTESEERRRKVLICEDSFTTRELERSIFEAAGYDVEVAMDGKEGIDKLRGGLGVDAVITDVQMPNMTGFELTRAIKSDDILEQIPVIIVTSLEREEEKAEGVEAGADAYITKSVFNQDTLLETVERLIR
jgi:chemotaxis protein histidine kinase CheA